MTSVKTYHVRHRLDLSDLLAKAQKVADFAVENKNNKRALTSKNVKEYGLPSAVSNQILRKYGRGTIKKATNVNLIVPNSSISERVLKNGNVKTYASINYIGERVILKPLKLSFRWNPGKAFEKINQVEIDAEKFMIAVTIKNAEPQHCANVLGIDLNCGVGRSVANCANLSNGEILNFGKQGPNTRKYYYKKHQSHRVRGHKEKRRMKDLDHKISRKIVDYALKHKLKIVVEDLKGIRTGKKKGNGLKAVNRFVNSWSFYRLQSFIEYKAKECGLPFEKIKPQYTSKECSFCSVIGERNGNTFTCKNKHCKSCGTARHSDVNAAFNIGKRSLLPGGRAQ
jgi:putative transposase